MPVALAIAGSEALGSRVGFASGFPPFLPREVEWIRDPAARRMARRIERLPVQISFAESAIMSSCVRPSRQAKLPVVLLHGFDSSCLEWSYSYPLLEDAGLETWALDVLGWGFSELGALSRCHVDAKREHLYQLWRSHIRRPMILVGPSLGAAIAIDFAAHYPKAVSKLVLINASVYAEGTGFLAKLPRLAACAGVGRLHCHMPWWEDATIDFMASGGYNVISHIKKRLCNDMVDTHLHQIPGCGHLPHVEKPEVVVKSIVDFAYRNM